MANAQSENAGNKAVAAAATVAAATAAQAPKAQPKANRTVTVACKVPNGIVIQCYDTVDDYEPVFGGGQKSVKKARPVGNPITLIGPSRAFGADPELKRVVGGYGLTFGVNADYFERWLSENKQLDMVRNGLIFAHENDARVVDQAKDMKTVQSGLEPLNPDKRDASGNPVDPRMKGLRKIKKLNRNEDLSQAETIS